MREKFFLQSAIALATIVPITAGFSGMIGGTRMLGGGTADMDSHFRYLSGLLFAIGIGFLTTIPKIENHKTRFRLLTMIVFTGGLARLYGFLVSPAPGHAMEFGLVMELIVTPLLCLWQHRVVRLMESAS